jgi:hypothetical protein
MATGSLGKYEKESVEGSQKAKDRMGRAYVTSDVERREAFAEGDLAGEGKESFLQLADTTQCLTSNKVPEEKPEKSLVHAMNPLS